MRKREKSELSIWNKGLRRMLPVLFLLLIFIQINALAKDRFFLEKRYVVVCQEESTTLYCEHAPDEKVMWISSKPWIASITDDGELTGHAKGSCDVYAICGNRVLECKVLVPRIRLSMDAAWLKEKETTRLSILYSKQRVKWISSNPKVASVSQNGLVKALRSGKCRITAICDGKQYKCSITVISQKGSKKKNKAAREQWKNMQKTVLLIGSSSFDFWEGYKAAFAPYNAVNVAISGTESTYWVEQMDTFMQQYRPAAVVIHVGSNDLKNGDGDTPEQAVENITSLMQSIHEKAPDIPVFYTSIVKNYARDRAWNAVEKTNAGVSAWCQQTDNMYYVDLMTHYVDENGLPSMELFKKDYMHPNQLAYERIWKGTIGMAVKQVLHK